MISFIQLKLNIAMSVARILVYKVMTRALHYPEEIKEFYNYMAGLFRVISSRG